MDLDTFFVSVSRLQNSALIGKPVLIGGSSERGVVASCSYEARALGVHSAMSMKLARRLCPDAIVVQGDYEEYSYYSNMVTDIIREEAPVYEKSSVDEFYLDYTGMERFHNTYLLASELRKRITRETGLPISFGLSENKTVSKIATGEAKPAGQLRIATGTEKMFLAPLPVKKIPMIGEKTAYTLHTMGVEKVHTLQQMPVEHLENVFGENGRVIWKKAQGIDFNPVEPYSERKSISCEETFNQDTIEVGQLKSTLISMAEKLSFQLRREEKLSSCITVKIRYSNFDTQTMQSRIGYTSCDHVLIDKAKELFDKLYQRRMLVRLVGLRLSHLVGGSYQINLFDDSEEMIRLYQAMDKMRIRFGEDSVKRAVSTDYKIKAFNPFNGKSR